MRFIAKLTDAEEDWLDCEHHIGGKYVKVRDLDSSNPEEAKILNEELETLKGLNHPNLVSEIKAIKVQTRGLIS